MVIQASSHKYSPVSVHRRLVGKTRSVLRSALGLAYLSSLSRSDLARTLDVLLRIGTLEGQDLAILGNIDSRLEEIHRRGYALSVGLIEENISAIALPFKLGRKSIGAVNIAFFRTAMSPAEAAATCLQPLRECIAQSEAALKAQTRY